MVPQYTAKVPYLGEAIRRQELEYHRKKRSDLVSAMRFGLLRSLRAKPTGWKRSRFNENLSCPP